MKLTWILFLTCGLVLVTRSRASPPEDIEVRFGDDDDDNYEEPDILDPDQEPDEKPSPDPNPIEVKDFPDVFNIEGTDSINKQVGFSVGVEYVGKDFSRFSDEVYLQHKRGGDDKTNQDKTVFRSKIRLSRKESDETVVFLEDNLHIQEVFQLHENDKTCRTPHADQMTKVFSEIKEFFPAGFDHEMLEIRRKMQNQGFYLGPAASIFHLGMEWFKDKKIKYTGRYRGDDVRIPKDNHDHESVPHDIPSPEDLKVRDKLDANNTELNTEFPIDTGMKTDPFVGLKELNTWSGVIKIGRYSTKNQKKVNVTFKFSVEKDASNTEMTQIPISFEVEYPSDNGKEPERQSLFFTSFKYFKDEKNEDLPVITVPIGFGCRRFKEIVDNQPKNKMPNFFEDNFDVEMEVVYSLCLNKYLESCTESIFAAKMHHLKDYNMVSVDQTEISVEEETSRQQVKHIVDFHEMLTYEIKPGEDSCQSNPVSDDFGKIDDHKGEQTKGTEMKWRYAPSLVFNEGLQKLKLFQPKFFSVQDHDFFLGNNTIRGVHVLTYEGEYEHQYVSDEKPLKVRVTKHFIDDKTTVSEGVVLTNNAPTELVFKVIDPSTPNVDTSITINIHKFVVGVLDPEVVRTTFDVTNCFKQPLQSTWFEIVFPLQEELAEQLLISEKSIENAFRTALGELPPNRLPVVIVDQTPNFILISAQLLDRPEDIFDRITYQQILHGQDNKEADASNSMLIESRELCERKCLDSEVDKSMCTAFSFCESLECDLHFTSQDNVKPAQFTPVHGCYSYKKKDNVPNNIMDGNTLAKHTIPGVLNMIDQMIEEKELKIIIDRQNENNTVASQDIEATLLVRDVEPGFLSNKEIKKKDDKEDDLTTLTKGYILHKRNTEFVYNDEALAKFKMIRLAGLEPQGCARSCDDDDNCKSFSICTDASMNCILSPSDYENITEEMLDKNKFSCSVMTSKPNKYNDLSILLIIYFVQTETFLYDYDKMEKMKLTTAAKEVIKVSNPEACAKNCGEKTTFECRSFDFCEEKTETGSNTACFLHESHILHANEAAQKVGLDLNTTTCDHFSSEFG